MVLRVTPSQAGVAPGGGYGDIAGWSGTAGPLVGKLHFRLRTSMGKIKHAITDGDDSVQRLT